MDKGKMKHFGSLTRVFVFLLSLVILFSFLASCRQSESTATPDALVKSWLEAWKAMDLDKMLQMTADSYKNEVQRFFGSEFKSYARVDYQDLKLKVLNQTSNEATVQAEFIAILESGSNPIFGGPSMVTKSSVRHTYELVREGDFWLVKSISRQPGA